MASAGWQEVKRPAGLGRHLQGYRGRDSLLERSSLPVHLGTPTTTSTKEPFGRRPAPASSPVLDDAPLTCAAKISRGRRLAQRYPDEPERNVETKR